MAKPQVFQGSWDELSARAEGYKDRSDLTLIIPGEDDEKQAARREPQTLAEALSGKIGLVSFDPPDLSQDTGKRFAALLAEGTITSRNDADGCLSPHCPH